MKIFTQQSKLFFRTQGRRVYVQQHMRQRQTQFNGLCFAVKHAGIAVPALVRSFHFRKFAFFGFEAEYLQGADVGTDSAADAFFGIDYRWHNFSFLVQSQKLTVGKWLFFVKSNISQ